MSRSLRDASRATDPTRCLTAVDAPHGGSPDVETYPPSLAEISAAAASLRDSTKAPDLFRICGSIERCEVILSITCGLAVRRWAS